MVAIEIRSLGDVSELCDARMTRAHLHSESANTTG